MSLSVSLPIGLPDSTRSAVICAALSTWGPQLDDLGRRQTNSEDKFEFVPWLDPTPGEYADDLRNNIQ